MANFHTHLNVALVASSIPASLGIVSGVYGAVDGVVLLIAGAIGGLLPDIDLNHSKISRIGFNVASGVGAGFGILLSVNHHPATPLHSLLWGGLAFLVFRYGVFGIFGRVTVHRGMVHSVPYMAVLSLILVNFLYFLLKIPLDFAWLVGAFVFFGSLIHLILDEIYSVNILGLKVKKSFGTAFKFFDKTAPIGYAFLYLFLIMLWLMTPFTPILSVFGRAVVAFLR